MLIGLIIALVAIEFARLVLEIASRKQDSHAEPEQIPAAVEPMTQEQFDEFAKSDAEAVQNFADAISSLNAFMTGSEEVTADAGKQERPE